MNFYKQNEKPSLYEFYFRFKTEVIGDTRFAATTISIWRAVNQALLVVGTLV